MTFQEGDAEELPFPDGSFDAVIMKFGLLHLGRPEQALAEAHRVLRAGGKLGFTVWAKPEEAVGLGVILRAVQDHGNMNVPLPTGPPFFRFSDPAECCRVLLEVGFGAPQVVTVPQVWRLRSPDVLFEMMQHSTVRAAGLLGAQTQEAFQAIRAALYDTFKWAKQRSPIPLPA